MVDFYVIPGSIPDPFYGFMKWIQIRINNTVIIFTTLVFTFAMFLTAESKVTVNSLKMWVSVSLKQMTCIYIFAFGEYNSKQVNVSGIQIFRAQFLALQVRKAQDRSSEN